MEAVLVGVAVWLAVIDADFVGDAVADGLGHTDALLLIVVEGVDDRLSVVDGDGDLVSVVVLEGEALLLGVADVVAVLLAVMETERVNVAVFDAVGEFVGVQVLVADKDGVRETVVLNDGVRVSVALVLDVAVTLAVGDCDLDIELVADSDFVDEGDAVSDAVAPNATGSNMHTASSQNAVWLPAAQK
jgi:hypothetical protein